MLKFLSLWTPVQTCQHYGNKFKAQAETQIHDTGAGPGGFPAGTPDRSQFHFGAGGVESTDARSVTPKTWQKFSEHYGDEDEN
jgi:hypothetical protein